MASAFLRPLFRPHALGLSLGMSLVAVHHTQQHPSRFDSSSSSVLSTNLYGNNAQVPVIKQGQLNPRAVRQISSGSIIGLCAGLAVSTFSRSLALFIGLLVVGIQWAASYGIKILPYDKLQRYVTTMNLRSAVQDNVAFKLAFGMTFAGAAFMHF